MSLHCQKPKEPVWTIHFGWPKTVSSFPLVSAAERFGRHRPSAANHALAPKYRILSITSLVLERPASFKWTVCNLERNHASCRLIRVKYSAEMSIQHRWHTFMRIIDVSIHRTIQDCTGKGRVSIWDKNVEIILCSNWAQSCHEIQ